MKFFVMQINGVNHMIWIVFVIIPSLATCRLMSTEETQSESDKRLLVNQTAYILCNLSVKSIYVAFEDQLETNIVDELLNGYGFCAPPVTLIKLVVGIVFAEWPFCIELNFASNGNLRFKTSFTAV